MAEVWLVDVPRQLILKTEVRVQLQIGVACEIGVGGRHIVVVPEFQVVFLVVLKCFPMVASTRLRVPQLIRINHPELVGTLMLKLPSDLLTIIILVLHVLWLI